MASEFKPTPIPTGVIDVNGVPSMYDGKGGTKPLSIIKAQHQLEDQVVRKILGYAVALGEQVARFKQHTFDDIAGFEALLAQEYDAKLGGAKGNKTLMTHDNLYKITVQVAERTSFGPELQQAKALVDECLNEWSETARAEIRAIVTQAFRTDKEGQVSIAQIFVLLRADIKDPRWLRAMDAIRDAMRVVGSKTYVRCYRRESFDGGWQAVSIDLAKA